MLTNPQDTTTAFPVTDVGQLQSEGLYLWDYFAAAALTGIAANGAIMPNETSELAYRAALIADEMIALRQTRIEDARRAKKAVPA